jgi:hypothetical protein
VRTAGDEMQAVIGTGPALAELASRWAGAEGGRWWLGIGLGDTDELGETSRDSRGPAFWHAREAVEAAKNAHRSPWGVAAVGEPREAAENLQAALNALARLIAQRTRRQREAAELAAAGASGTKVAERLGITPQAANRLLRAAGVEEQQQLEGLIGRLAREVA